MIAITVQTQTEIMIKMDGRIISAPAQSANNEAGRLETNKRGAHIQTYTSPRFISSLETELWHSTIIKWQTGTCMETSRLMFFLIIIHKHVVWFCFISSLLSLFKVVFVNDKSVAARFDPREASHIGD